LPTLSKSDLASETGTASVDAIASEVGYADGVTLRTLLRRKLGRGVRGLRSRRDPESETKGDGPNFVSGSVAARANLTTVRESR
jgi:hypothetical protein